MRLMIIGFLIFALTGCGKSPDVITGKPPFINVMCNYENYDELKDAMNFLSKRYGFDLKINEIDISNGSFSAVLWKTNFNIIVTGILKEKNRLFYTAIVRNGPNYEENFEARTILSSLPIKCILHD